MNYFTTYNQKGHIHLLAIFAVVFVLMIAYALTTKYIGSQRSDQAQYVVFDPPRNTRVDPVYEDPIATVLNSAAETQVRLLKLKIDYIAMSWNSLDDKTKRAILQSLKSDTENQYGKIKAIVQRLNTPEWKQSVQNREIYNLAKSIASEQQNIISFIDEYSKTLNDKR